MKGQLMTAAEAAKALGCAVPTIYRWIDEGKLRQVPVDGNAVIIDGRSVRRLQKEGDTDAR